nr:ac29 [Calliteara abietis nucleopolyhedrovirus]
MCIYKYVHLINTNQPIADDLLSNQTNKMSSFDNSNKYDVKKGSNSSTASNLRQQYDSIIFAKRQINIQTTHQEKLKKITKDSANLAEIDATLHTLRTNFLDFGVNNF